MPRQPKLAMGKKFAKKWTDNPKKQRGRPRKKPHPKILAVLKKEKEARVKNVYKIVNKMTGKIGGNGCGGPIYGELTLGNNQKVVDALVEYTAFSSESRFIDIGSGLGKPNIHVSQDPGVQFSLGIEIEEVRTNLGLINLHHVLREKENNANIGHTCLLQHGNISDAESLDPFTHVYAFDVG